MVMEVTGESRQLTAEQEQVVGPEVQEPRVRDTVTPRIEAPEKRETPLPVAPRPPLPAAAEIAEREAELALYGIPVVRINRYSGGDTDWQELVRWDIPELHTGDLHEISLLTDNDAKTRYRIVIGNVDQNIPTDRQTSTPMNLPWRRTILPGGTSVYVEVVSTDGTPINVDGIITGSVR